MVSSFFPKFTFFAAVLFKLRWIDPLLQKHEVAIR